MADLNEDFFYSGVAGLNARLVAREVSAVEVARAFCDRFEKHAPAYNAMALSLREQAIAQAKDVDSDLKIGRTRGPLQGIPFAVKDLLAVSMHRTTWGAKPFEHQVFDYDAAVVQRLKKARALLVGKVAMVELAGGGGYRYPSASLFGPGLNPWDRTRWSGGSSSGSGSVVAAGLVPFAIGSETNGSILNPSSYCGVTGLRPTYGLVSRHGAMALSWTLDKLGPMCRTAEDCGLVLQAIAGGDSRDPGSVGKGYFHSPKFFRNMKDLRMGFPADFDQWPDSPSRQAMAQALGTFRSIGLQLSPVKLPDLPYNDVVSIIIASEAASAFEELIRSGRVNELADQKQIAGLKAGMDITAADYLRAMRVRTLVQRAFREIFMSVDVLVSRSTGGTAPKIDQALDAGSSGGSASEKGLSSLTSAGNLAGLPAISVPCGFAENLPLGMQIVGRPFSETNLVAIAMEFQKQTDFHKRRPVLTAA
jgi:aspartyl-tRNA(Asn)/glutamyl-tRNA(Gln) amidotransferase subunit A